jgi:predicted nucleotidyltransferase
LTFHELFEVARGRDDVVGLYVFGSRGRNFMVDERSDWDVCVVLRDDGARDAFDVEFQYVHGARVEITTATLDELRTATSEHGRYAGAHARVVRGNAGYREST